MTVVKDKRARHDRPRRASIRWLRLVVAMLVGLSCAVTLPGLEGARDASARPLVVRTQTRLQVEATPHGRRPRIRARLVDNVNQGVAGKKVALTVHHATRGVVERRTLETDSLGYANAELELDDGTYSATVAFEGDGAHDGSASGVELVAERASLSLSIEAPELVHVQSETTLDIGIRGRVPFRIDEPVRVELVIGRGETAWRQPAELVPMQPRAASLLDGMGVELGALARARARDLPRARQPIRVEFEGNDLFEPAEADAETMLFRGPRMRFTTELIRERDRRGVAMHGTLESQEGPLHGATVVAELRNARDAWTSIGRMETEPDGHFSAFVPLDDLPTGTVVLRAAFTPDAGEALRSEPVTIEVDPAGATGWISWILVGLLVLVAGAIALVYALQSLRAAWSRWRERRTPVLGQTETELVTLEADPSRPAPPGLDAISGLLFDASRSAPVSPGRVVLVASGGARDAEPVVSVEVDDSGWFVAHNLPAGRWRLWGMAHGYMSGHAELTVPHDGRFRSFRFDLVPVRQQVRDIYRWLLERYAPDERLWGRLTPREVEHRLAGNEIESLVATLERSAMAGRSALLSRARQALSTPSTPVVELLDVVTSLLEEVYYSQRIFPEEVALAAEALAERLRDPLIELRAAGARRAADAVALDAGRAAPRRGLRR